MPSLVVGGNDGHHCSEEDTWWIDDMSAEALVPITSSIQKGHRKGGKSWSPQTSFLLLDESDDSSLDEERDIIEETAPLATVEDERHQIEDLRRRCDQLQSILKQFCHEEEEIQQSHQLILKTCMVRRWELHRDKDILLEECGRLEQKLWHLHQRQQHKINS